MLRLREPAASHPGEPAEARLSSAFSRADAITLAVEVVLVAAAVAVGVALNTSGHTVGTASPPIYAVWRPHVSAGSACALLIAALVCVFGPPLARRLRWMPLLVAAYLSALAWTMALAMIDGWKEGFAGRLTTDSEYLHDVPGITDVGAMLRGFTGRILDYQPDSWVTHVSGHPPGVTLIFVWLDRIGLGGGTSASIACVGVGAVAAVGVPVTIRLLDGEQRARAIVPFVVLFPGAVWVGASADGLFMGVTVAGLTLLAAAARLGAPCGARLGAPLLALGAGLVLGGALFLSYGMVLIALPALAIVLVTRRWRIIVWALLGAATVVAGFAVAGFWWLDGYHLVVERYYQGIASERAYAYWIWANLACLVLSAGPATIVALRRALAASKIAVTLQELVLRRINSSPVATWGGVVALPLAALTAILIADLSGMSKAEVERIWLPFTIWLIPAAALLPARSHRGWLAVQAATALAVNHLLFTIW